MPAIPHSKAADHYLVVLCLDIEQFGRYTDTQSTQVASAFRDVIEQAFQHAGLSDTYAAHAFHQNSGDGIVAGFDPSRLAQIVDRIPSALQFGLRELHQQSGFGVRMRMGISYGPVQGINDRRVDVAPNRTIVEACRICDADPTRLLLRNADPEATFLAVAVTEPVVDFTVARNPLWLRQSEFVATEVSLASKDFRTNVFLHVPAPSGGLLRSGLLGHVQDDEEPPGPPLEERVERSACVAYSLKGDIRAEQGQANQIGQVAGDVHGERTSIDRVSGDGAIGAVTGGSVTQDRSSHSTYVAGDQISANRDAHVTKIGWERAASGNGKHRFHQERTERGEQP